MNRIIGTAVTLAAVAWGQTQVDAADPIEVG